MQMNQKGKGRDDYQTPEWLYVHLDRQHKFTVDAACKISNSLCHRGFYWPIFDGLRMSWADERVFCNPPFSAKDAWIKKAYTEVMEGDCPVVVMILPVNSMTTEAWHEFIHGKFFYQFSPSRYSFFNPDTLQYDDNNNSGTVIVYFIKPLPKQTDVRRKWA